MKRVIMLMVAALVVAGPAVAGIDGSAHDLGARTDIDLDTADRICVFCHTPHNPNGTAGAPPLWNRTVGSVGTTYIMYDDAISDTMDMVVDPMNASQMNGSTVCLSCHDGTVGLGAVFNAPEWGTLTNSGTLFGALTLGNPNSFMGTDLSNDHPVNVVYSVGTGANQDPDFDPAMSNTSAGVHLDGGKVQCVSCHDPHDNDSWQPFLVADNTNSALCSACHTK